MNDTNLTTQIAGQIAAHTGFQLSGAEITMACTLAGGAVHVIHQIVAAGGIKNVLSTIWSGKKTN